MMLVSDDVLRSVYDSLRIWHLINPHRQPGFWDICHIEWATHTPEQVQSALIMILEGWKPSERAEA